MKTNPPPHRRKFTDKRDELEYLYHKLLYWLYDRQDRERALTFAKRLARVLSKTSAGHDAIFPQECWSLVFEAKADLRRAITHRQKEVRLLKRLHEISRGTEDVLRLYGHDDLSDRLDLLAVLYHDAGQIDRAIATLKESENLCLQHGIPFDGEDMLREYQQELNSKKRANGTRNRR